MDLSVLGIVVQAEHPVGHLPVGYEFDGAVVELQLFRGDEVGVVVVQPAVDAGDGLDVGANGAQVVGDHDDGHRAVEVAEDGIEFLFEMAVDVGGGLVEDEDARRGDDGAAEEDALHLPAGQLADGARGVFSHAVFFQELAGFPAVGAGVGGEDSFLGEQPGEDDFLDADGETAVECAVLRQVAEEVVERDVADDFAGGGFEQAEYHFEEGGFSSAVGSDDAEEIPFVDAEVDVLQDGLRVVAGGNVFEFEERGHSFAFRMSINRVISCVQFSASGSMAMASPPISRATAWALLMSN